VFSSVDIKLVVIRFSLVVDLRSCQCHYYYHYYYYYSITCDYHHHHHLAQPHSYPYAHGIGGVVNSNITRTREPATTASPLLITPAIFLLHPKTNAASKQRRKLCT
jgi:hypothetical protein